MNLKDLIQSIDSRIEIIDFYAKKSFFGEMIDFLFFKIGTHYYLISELKNNYIITEQTPDGAKDISAPIWMKKDALKVHIESLIKKNLIVN